jgi:DNA-binding MarR family transcriptional regulator
MPRAEAVRLPCACANLRRAARVVTQLYDSVLRPSGLRVTQFTLLQALNRAPGLAQNQLAELLGIDSTTLTRTLAFLHRKGWIRSERGNDRRKLQIFLSPAGQREYKRVFPYWQWAQRRLRQALGEANWNQVVNAAVLTAGVAPKAD